MRRSPPSEFAPAAGGSCGGGILLRQRQPRRPARLSLDQRVLAHAAQVMESPGSSGRFYPPRDRRARVRGDPRRWPSGAGRRHGDGNDPHGVVPPHRRLDRHIGRRGLRRAVHEPDLPHGEDMYSRAELMCFERFEPRLASGAAYLRGQGVGRVRGVSGSSRARRPRVEANPPSGAPGASSYEGEGYVSSVEDTARRRGPRPPGPDPPGGVGGTLSPAIRDPPFPAASTSCSSRPFPRTTATSPGRSMRCPVSESSASAIGHCEDGARLRMRSRLHVFRICGTGATVESTRAAGEHGDLQGRRVECLWEPGVVLRARMRAAFGPRVSASIRRGSGTRTS